VSWQPKAPLANDPPEAIGTPITAGRLNAAANSNRFSRAASSRAQLWLRRILVLIFVFVCAVVGVLLVILPWHPEWTDNRLLLAYPGLRPIISNNFVRGVCSGLGILDIWIGFWEAVHYHEAPRSTGQ
jgi:hypothetical protein